MSKFESADTLEKAAIFYIKYLVEREFWNKNQRQIEDNPFENDGGEIVAVGDIFKLWVKAYSWNPEKDGYLKFYFMNKLAVEFRWHKHCLRGLEVRYGDADLEEAIGLIEDCLVSELESIAEK